MPKAKTAKAPAAKKPRAPKGPKLAEKFPNGEVLRDLCKKYWTLGDVIGQGGFGLIYLASDTDRAGPDAEYVVKIEPISNGPLFCELHFYQRVAKPDLIDSWVKSRKLKYLGVPKYIASGQHEYKGVNYRFMVMERFSTDLQKVFEAAGKMFSKQTVYALALRMIDSLEYLHENHYIHADIKASNCLLGYKNGKTDVDSIHLVDFGLAAKYAPGGTHKDYKEDPRKAHDGTVEFTSTDAHKGVDGSRRGDMEILGYCLLQWLCGRLPWEDKLADKNYVRDAKIKGMNDIPGLMKKCFPKGGAPAEISSYLTMVKNISYDDKPNYNKMRELFQKGLASLGVKDQWKLALPIAGTSGKAPPKKGVKRQLKDSEPDEPVIKMKARAASPKPGTPKAGSRPATPKTAVQRATPKTTVQRATPKTTAQKTKLATPKQLARATPTSAAKKTGKKTEARSPLARTPKSPAAGKARAVGAKAIAGTLSPIASPVAGRSVNGTAKRVTSPTAGSPAPKRRKAIRRKNVQMSEMAVQTSPGLKKNR
ncbi:serine/threonine-protein kinase VRK1-like [Mercenaria mercenaria]|uniref:serine/threonine-protein kinase VRK1-like n=1 Tax=Mercenaria mercenaria TaxID=6596 RepID=UPI00234F76D4|nr:serine/threonine-protein kinase VRK1-like [Mercenaria mercenaria]